ncbi:hypothetical protein H310_00380 [Aphanomyces invadans]|uniref:EF-hand domain-containing protein n=1 Tax=Aphanomyces invadans TaxID=157072 RepID=A0A024UWF3_9STRA|nr:hypothetical protein H310_00380 [Aphanomyces invadans]ETW09963.1 hypothetical protein H310_00380 [Aphanomyces invadans]|eukprot:XP_008861374.1 hypothetical protein H310_00380 [Aphanomyces invadans]
MAETGEATKYGTMAAPPATIQVKSSTLEKPRRAGSRMLSLRHLLDFPHADSKRGFNPFVYQTPTMSMYERVKTVVMCVLLVPVIRMLLVMVLLVPIVFLAFVGTLGHSHQDKDGHLVPMARWRRCIVYPIRWFIRAILFVFGFYYIKVTHPPKSSPRKVLTQLIVANHIGFIDGLFFAAHCFPSVAVRGDMGNAPIIGPVLRAMDPVLIDRKSAAGRKKAFTDIHDHMKDTRFPPLLIFPEGTTSSQDYLTKFKKGAFAAGLPVQPVLLKYPFRYFDISWPPGVSAGYLLFRMLCQVYMPMEVTFLPAYEPSPTEQSSPDLFAENVRQYMAKPMNAKCTNHTFEDVRLLCQVGSYGLQNVAPVTDVGEIFQLTHLTDDAIAALVGHFAAADTNGDGKISLEELTARFDEEPEFVARLFQLLDQDEDGQVDFRELCMGLSTLNQAQQDSVTPTHLYRLAFHLYDSDGSGHLSKTELKAMLRMTRAMSGLQQDSAAVDALVQSFDVDGDGQISLQEFEKMAQVHPDVLKQVVDSLKVLRTLDSAENDDALAAIP